MVGIHMRKVLVSESEYSSDKDPEMFAIPFDGGISILCALAVTPASQWSWDLPEGKLRLTCLDIRHLPNEVEEARFPDDQRGASNQS
jgi:hypothetical protein